MILWSRDRFGSSVLDAQHDRTSSARRVADWISPASAHCRIQSDSSAWSPN
jgi:hypothetical protein